MPTFNFLKEGKKIKDKLCEKHKKDCYNLNTKIYCIENKIFAIYSFDDCSDRFLNNCKLSKYKLIYKDGQERYEFPKIKCKKCKIIVYNMLY